MKRFLSLLLMLVLALSVMPVMARADDPTDVMEVYNCNEYVSLRESPDTKSKVLKKVYKGDLVYLYNSAAGNGFYQVEFDGKVGYILSKYLKGTTFKCYAVILPNQQVYNCSEWVSLRKEENAQSERLIKVPLGAVVTRCVDGNGTWIYCTYKGKSGYIKKDYLRTADYDKIKREEEERKRKEEEEAAKNYPKTPFDCMQVVNAQTWVSLRKEPSTDSKRLYEIPAFAYVTNCLYVNANWVHVYYNGMDGYVSAKYLAPAVLPNEPAEPDPVYEEEEEEAPRNGFDLLPALPAYADFMATGDLVCEATYGSYHVIARRAYGSDKEELLAVCYDSSNRPLWTAREQVNGIAQVDCTSAFIAGTKLFPYLVTFCSDGKGFTARAIDGKGTLLWTNDCVNKGTAEESVLPGGGLTVTVDEDGTIYAIGFFNDAPIAIDVNGSLLWKGINPDPLRIYWPYEMSVVDSYGAYYANKALAVTYDSCIDEEGTAYMILYDIGSGSCILFNKVLVSTADEEPLG